MPKFSDSMLWGSSTNAQQFEGAYDADGKGLTIADVRNLDMDTITPSDFDKFKVASDHYHHLNEDIELWGQMGMQIQRFTMAWARIFPNGDDAEPNAAGFAFYDRMVDGFIARGIVPVCTLYAYDLPLSLLERFGGWASRKTIDAYLRYVRTVVTHFKGRIKYYVPFNEQNFMFDDYEYITGSSCDTPLDVFRLEHHCNLALAQATCVIHECDPDAKCGGNVGNSCFYPATCAPADAEAADELYYRCAVNFGDICARGEYTPRYLDLYRGFDLSEVILPGDLDIIASIEPDFLSTTYYTSVIISKDTSLKDAMDNRKVQNPYCNYTDWGWSIDPYGFKRVLEDLWSRYRLPIVVMENGMGAYDTVEEDGSINDTYRIDYLRAHIERMAEAVANGVQVEAYMTWSATDLYSTREGLEKRYGFVYVDSETLERKKKASFEWYKKVMASNGEDLA